MKGFFWACSSTAHWAATGPAGPVTSTPTEFTCLFSLLFILAPFPSPNLCRSSLILSHSISFLGVLQRSLFIGTGCFLEMNQAVSLITQREICIQTWRLLQDAWDDVMVYFDGMFACIPILTAVTVSGINCAMTMHMDSFEHLAQLRSLCCCCWIISGRLGQSMHSYNYKKTSFLTLQNSVSLIVKAGMYVTAAAGTSPVQLQKLLLPPNALSQSPHGPRSSPTFSQNIVLLSLIPLHSQWMKKATRFSLCLLFSNCLKLPSFDLSPPAYRCSCAPATPRETPSQEQGWSVTLPSGPSLQETDHVLGTTFLLLQGLHICHGPVSTPS